MIKIFLYFFLLINHLIFHALLIVYFPFLIPLYNEYFFSIIQIFNNYIILKIKLKIYIK
jgi:hypothetical protein